MTTGFAVPSTQIRPLGEEHLRMFRRTTTAKEAASPSVTIPKVARKLKGYMYFITSTNGKILEIIISERVVTAPEFLELKPPHGFRRITKEDGGRMWRWNEDFRRELKAVGIWTGERGVRFKEKNKGCEIGPNGEFLKTPQKQLVKLPEERVAWFYTGEGLIRLGLFFGISGKHRLDVFPGLGPADDETLLNPAWARKVIK